jgi:hypothetical protein
VPADELTLNITRVFARQEGRQGGGQKGEAKGLVSGARRAGWGR